MAYRLPPPDIVRIFDAPDTPVALPSLDRRRIALLEPQIHPPLEVISRPFLRLAGVRIDPDFGGLRVVTPLESLRFIGLDGGPAVEVRLPDRWFTAIGSFFLAPVARPLAAGWSPDGSKFALLRCTAEGKELWLADTATGELAQVPGLRVLDAVSGSFGGAPIRWLSDGRLLVTAAPERRASVPGAEPTPRIEETTGKRSEMATFQDLLQSERDDALFEHLATSRLCLVDPLAGTVQALGAEGLIYGFEPSPDGRFLLVDRVRRPFSHRVPWPYFARATEVWDWSGGVVQTVADLPVADEVPRQGVPTGPRDIGWQPNRGSSLVWAEALDGGDPKRKVPHRDALWRWDAPFAAAPEQRLKFEHRLVRSYWLPEADSAVFIEFDRDRRWQTWTLRSLAGDTPLRVIADLSVNDAYHHPGAPVEEQRADGSALVVHDAGRIYLAGEGAGEDGLRPFLDRLELQTGAAERLFESATDRLEYFLCFADQSRSEIVTWTQSPADAPNLLLRELGAGSTQALTAFTDPHPELTASSKRLVRYTREDGVALSGTLHLPAGYEPGSERLPLLIWAYPMDYSDPATAGQVRGSDRTFTRAAGLGPLWFLLRGWAVLEGAAMPVVGDPDTMNDTFVEQVVASARAAIDELDRSGICDRRRVVVGGHSYGGFMTATLLAHSNLFAAGIARSGAYNRWLTPFGFQTERRSFWETPDVYSRVSPFRWAHQITAPILLVHGEADSNSGTYPLQSERLFQALQGLGGTARLVLLPFEDHAYRARESVLHVIAEQLDWVDRWVSAPSPARPEEAAVS